MTSTSECSSINKDNLLNNFPFQEDELDQLLILCAESLDELPNRVGTAATIIPQLDLLIPIDCVSTLVQSSVTLAFCLDDTPLNKVLEGLSALLGRRGPRPVLDILWSSCQMDDDSQATKTTLLDWIFRISKASHVLQTGQGQSEEALSIPKEWHSADISSRPLFMEWTSAKLPEMYTAVATFFHCILLPGFVSGKTPFFHLPQLDQPSDLPLDQMSLGLLSTKFQGRWRRIYNNLDDGSSFEILQQSLIGYQGPTTLIIQTLEGELFGYFTECPWRLCSKWFGAPGTNVSHFYDNADSFLFTLKPELQLFPATGIGKFYQYLHTPPSHRSSELKGLCIGGISSDCPRVQITTDWMHCKATSIDTTYENGFLLEEGQNYFDISVIEVYATSVGDTIYEQNQVKGQLQVDISESHRIHKATVDKTQFLDDLVSDVFPNKGFAHRNVVQGGEGV